MEVHSHTHTPRKKWSHYIWEFLMLFLAVFCGFLAENQREHIIEKKREKDYVRSIIEDIKADTAWLTTFMSNQKMSSDAFDSVIILLNLRNRTESAQQRLYYLMRIAIRYSDFYKSNENAYDQMKNSGNLRLLHKQNVADSISRYYFNAKEAALYTEQALLRQQSLLDFEGKLFDGTVMQQMLNKESFAITAPTGNPALVTEDRVVINECIVRIHYVFSLMLFSKTMDIEQKVRATGLIRFLQKEYHLE